MSGGCLSWLHFGDIHAGAEDGWLGGAEGRIEVDVDPVVTPGGGADEGARGRACWNHG